MDAATFLTVCITANYTLFSLLVTSGWCGDADNFYPCPTKVINFDRQTKTCDSLPNYPEANIVRATGGLIGHDTYLSCGGKVPGGLNSNKCYKFGLTTPIATMRKRRSLAASVVISNKLWVTGGEDEYGEVLKSTEFVEPDTGSIQSGPDLPKEAEAACLVLVYSTKAMLIGGYPDPQYKTWFYNFENELQGWVTGPDLIIGREMHACGIVKDSVEGKAMVIAAGKSSYMYTHIHAH